MVSVSCMNMCTCTSSYHRELLLQNTHSSPLCQTGIQVLLESVTNTRQVLLDFMNYAHNWVLTGFAVCLTGWLGAC